MPVHQQKDSPWIAKFPKGTLPGDPGRTRKYFGRGIEAETAVRLFNDSLSLIKHAPEHLKRFLIIACYCGARSGATELLSLTWDKVDFENNTILIVSARKGGRDSRLIPLKPDFRRLLKGWKETKGEGRYQCPSINCGFWFLARPEGVFNRRNSPLFRGLKTSENAARGRKMPFMDGHYLIAWRGRPIKCIRGAFNRVKRKAKIDPNRKLPPYAFRHAFVTAALNAGGDLKGVSEMAGHSRTETTTRIYQHTNINLHRGIVENLPPIITVDG